MATSTMAEGLSRSYSHNHTSYLWQSDWRGEIQRWNRAARCFLRIYIPSSAEISSPTQPGGDQCCQRSSMVMVVDYLDQQKHFVCDLFDSPNFEANIVVLSKFIEDLESLVVSFRENTRWLTCLSPARIFNSENLCHSLRWSQNFDT